jgi:ABC-type uncharacterized transport system substrate-binding protein
MIESESEADKYLIDILKNPEHPSMDEIKMRAQKYIKDEHLRKYFVSKANEMLR